MITAVVCSDDRMLFVYKKLHMYKEVIAIDETTDFLTLPRLDALVLPVKGIDEDGYLRIREHRIHVPAMFWRIQKEMLIFCGMPCTYVKTLPQRKDYYLEAQHVIEENAMLTVEGVLYLLISSISKSLYDIDVDIIGYGNCGKAIHHMLGNLDVKTRVIRRECKEDQNFIKISSWNDCADVIVNTSIQKVIEEKHILTWSKRPIVIDIATPDVVDQALLKAYDMTFIKAPNLPGRFCAESAGRIIADYVRGKLIK